MTAVMLALTLATGLGLLVILFRSLRPASLAQRLSLVKVEVPIARRMSDLFSERLSALFVSTRRLNQALLELPDFIELLAVALTSGESIYSALRRVVPRMNGVLFDELSSLITALDLGSDLETELASLGQRLPQRQVLEFTSKLNLALRRGTPLAQMLWEQSDSVRQEVHNHLTKLAGRNETRMLIPLIFLILPVTVLFAIYPSLQMLNLEYL